MSNLCINYSSHKINKVRWYNKSFHNDRALFITGTNHSVLSKNRLSVWSLESRSTSDEIEELASVSIDGIVTDLKVIEYNNKPLIIGSTSKGSLFIYSVYNLPNKFQYAGYNENNNNGEYEVCNLLKEKIWNSSGNNNSINSIDTSFDQQHLVSVGSDGCMNLYQLDSFLPIYTNRHIDGLGVNVVKSISSTQVITSGESGNIKLWDIRSNQSSPVKSIKTNCQRIFSLAIHQQDQNIIAAGSSNGQVNLYDIRSDYSIDQNKLHNSNVWELSFNKSKPNQLYSCSDDGSIYQYSYEKDNLMSQQQQYQQSSTTYTDNSFDIYSKQVQPIQLPASIGSVDSFDINSSINRLICCSTSSQSLIIIKN